MTRLVSRGIGALPRLAALALEPDDPLALPGGELNSFSLPHVGAGLIV